MTDLQKLEERFSAEVNQSLAPHGYKFDEISKCFEKSELDFTYQFEVTLYERHGQLTCTPEVGIRCDRVEEVFHRTSEFNSTDAMHTATLGGSIRLIADSSKYSIAIEGVRDVDAAVRTILRAFEDVAFPYFQRHCDLSVIDLALNQNPNEGSIHMINERFRCSKGLIVAKLVGRKNYAEIRRIYDERMRRIGTITYDRYFRPLLNDLDGWTPR